MKKLQEILECAKKAQERMAALLDLAGNEDRDLTEDEQKEFDECEATVTRCTEEAAVIQRANDASAQVAAIAAQNDAATEERTATPGIIRGVTAPGNAPSPGVSVNQPDLDQAQTLGVMAWGLAKQKQSPSKGALIHIEEAGFQRLADQSREVSALIQRSILTLPGSPGENTVDTPLSTEFIEFLRNESAFLAGNPIELDMSFGSLEIPGGLVGTSGSYGAEGADIGYTQMTTRKIAMSAKHLSAVTAVSNFNLDVSPLAMAQIVGDDLQMGLRLAMDNAGLRSDGAGDAPTGILSLVNASHKFDATAEKAKGKPTLAEVDFEARKALNLIRSSNIPKRRRRWSMANRVFTYLQFMRDGNGNLVFPGLSKDSPTWYDNYPVTVSEQHPTNLGSSTDESEIMLVDYGHVLVGIARALRMKASDEATYVDAGDNTVSAFSRDETVIRGIGSHDFEMRHDKAGVVIEAVTWGA